MGLFTFSTPPMKYFALALALLLSSCSATLTSPRTGIKYTLIATPPATSVVVGNMKVEATK